MSTPQSKPDTEARRDWMGLLARAPSARLAQLLQNPPAFTWLRAPEIGAVMLRGRMDALGAPFNLGEMTVTRCVLRLESGAQGHATVQGRDKAHATRCALVDALMQTEAAAQIAADILAPLRAERAQEQAKIAAEVAATKVSFFTMVRGED